MSEAKPLRVEKDGHIAWVVLNRPEKRNAMTLEMFQDMMTVFDELDLDKDVRAVIIKGEGKGFCGGMDVATLAGLVEETGADFREYLRREIVRFQHSMTCIEECRKPVIVAVHGVCVGGGVDLASACDIRIASKDAYFSVRETKLALVADLGTLQRLPNVVGEPWARELALTGRNFSAEEARSIGFITHMLDDRASLEKKALELANEIATCSPLAVQGVKDVMRFNRENGVRAGLQYVAQKNASILMCEDALEAFAAMAEKRAPVFKGK